MHSGENAQVHRISEKGLIFEYFVLMGTCVHHSNLFIPARSNTTEEQILLSREQILRGNQEVHTRTKYYLGTLQRARTFAVSD